MYKPPPPPLCLCWFLNPVDGMKVDWLDISAFHISFPYLINPALGLYAACPFLFVCSSTQ